jgi:lipoate-protein ligase A
MDVKRQVKLPCFLAPNRDEVMVQGKKLVGSAQKRTSQAVLQHGSLPLTPAYRDLPDYLLIDSGEKKRQRELLAHKSICINEIDPALRFDLLVNALKDGFLTLPGIIPAEQGWTDLEKIEIYSIVTSNEFQQQWCN